MHDAETYFKKAASRFDALAIEHALPGAVVGVVKDGALVYTHGTGETQLGNGRAPTLDSVFRIASMTKSFTAAAVMLLRDRGKLSLDDAMTQYLPWTGSIGSPRDAHAITVRDLLTMNAGFPTDDPWGDRQENTPVATFDRLVERGLSFARPPRTGFEYSNLGYALLGRIITAAARTEYLDFVARELLEPLGMRSTVFGSSDVDEARRAYGYAHFADGLVPEPAVGTGAFSPMGGLHSTVRDMATWIWGFCSAWTRDTAHPLTKSTRREMQEGRTHARTTVVEASESGAQKTITSLYCYGLSVDVDSALGTFVYHSGGYPGFGSHMRWHPASGWGIVALANKTYGAIYDAAAETLTDLVAEYSPATGAAASFWPATLHAMDASEQLFACWDDALADAHFAVNMDLDQPGMERRAALAKIAAGIGTFKRDEESNWISASRAHVKWNVKGKRGRAIFEILLSPEKTPKIQTLKVTASM